MTRSRDFTIGAVVLGAVVLVVAAAIWLGDIGPRGPKTLHTARFRTVGGVKAGDPVVLRGVKVGRVEAIRLAERYGNPDSARFVNGVLDALARKLGRL